MTVAAPASPKLANYKPLGDGVALIELNDPPANTYTHEMMRDLDEAILAARFDDDTHVVVLTGFGEKFFCAGANIKMLSSVTPKFKYYFCLHANETLSRMEQTPKLFIAALNGHCVGGGLEIAGHRPRIARKDAGKIMGLPGSASACFQYQAAPSFASWARARDRTHGHRSSHLRAGSRTRPGHPPSSSPRTSWARSTSTPPVRSAQEGVHVRGPHQARRPVRRKSFESVSPSSAAPATFFASGTKEGLNAYVRSAPRRSGLLRVMTRDGPHARNQARSIPALHRWPMAGRRRGEASTSSIRNRRVVTRVAEASRADVDAVAAKAFHAGPWASMSPPERARLLWKLAGILEQRTPDIARLTTLRTATDLREPVRGSSGHGRRLPARVRAASRGRDHSGARQDVHYTLREPLGVIAAIVRGTSDPARGGTRAGPRGGQYGDSQAREPTPP